MQNNKMKKILYSTFIGIILILSMSLYFNEPPAQGLPIHKETFIYDIKAIDAYNEKGVKQIVAKRKSTEKQVIALEHKVTVLKKENAILIKKIIKLEQEKKEVVIIPKKDSVVTNIPVKKKRNFIQKILNKK